MDRTIPAIIGMTLALAFLAFAALTAADILRAVIISLCRDIRDAFRKLRTWWRNRRPEPGWQPKPSWKRPGIRRPR